MSRSRSWKRSEIRDLSRGEEDDRIAVEESETEESEEQAAIEEL